MLWKFGWGSCVGEAVLEKLCRGSCMGEVVLEKLCRGSCVVTPKELPIFKNSFN